MSSVLRRFPAVLIGLVFLLSSSLKMVDPVGTSLIVESYLKFLHIRFLDPVSIYIGVGLCLAEAYVGIGLVTGVKRRFFAISTLVMLTFFTIVSILLVIFNPSMDCGCFGEAIHLSHMQTLVKNLVMLTVALLIFLPLYNLGFASHHRWAAFISASILMTAFAVYPFKYEPIADFTKFQPSHTIATDQNVFDNAFEHPILPLSDISGMDCSDILTDGNVMVISIYDPNSLSDEQIKQLAVYAQDAFNTGFDNVVCLTPYSEFYLPGLDTYTADYKDLLTFNRSNGGSVFLSDGYIYAKHKVSEARTREQLSSYLAERPEKIYADTATVRSIGAQLFTILTLFCLLFL